MNTERMAAIIADPAAVAELKRCTSLAELVDCLNRDGAECTREEGLRFLRAWEKLEEDNEVIVPPDGPPPGL